MDDIRKSIQAFGCSKFAPMEDFSADERFYVVDFRHAKGVVIGVQGILLGSDGTPCLDHGLCIDVEDSIDATGSQP